jgi:hypothetical protein
LAKAIRWGALGSLIYPHPIWVRVDNYRGYVQDKDLEISKYKYCVVIENSPDYVSEKLFEATRNACLVFYDGPTLSEFGIPNGIVVECPKIEYHFDRYFERVTENNVETRKIVELAVKFHNSNEFLSLQNNFALRALAKLVSDVVGADNEKF